MITILLTILKSLGIILLILLITAVVLLLLVLFVPVRYRISLRRKEGDGTFAAIKIKVTWLLHLINVAFSYPEAAFLHARIFCFTVFRSDKKKKNSGTGQKKRKPVKKEEPSENKNKEKTLSREKSDSPKPEPEKPQKTEQEQEPEKKEFFLQLLSALQNIRYTITQICDKIKHIVNNIQYYLKILKSDTFSGAWTLCSGQAFSLLKSILPGKFSGSIVIGTGDPASTGQVLAVYGMLYPLLEGHITVTPDFEHQIVEGELFLRGKITVFKGLKTAWKIYFNRDLRRLIQLFKREAA